MSAPPREWPEDLRIAWSLTDVVIFVVFALGSGIVVSYLLLTLAYPGVKFVTDVLMA